MLGFEIGQRESGFYSERTESQTDRHTDGRNIQYGISIYIYEYIELAIYCNYFLTCELHFFLL